MATGAEMSCESEGVGRAGGGTLLIMSEPLKPPEADQDKKAISSVNIWSATVDIR